MADRLLANGADLEHLLDTLDRHLSALTGQVWAPRYEVTPVFSIGGPTGSYPIPPQWITPLEFMVLGAAFEDAGTLILTAQPNPAAPTNTSTLPGDGRIPQIVLASAGVGTVSLPENWSALPAGAWLTLATNINSSHSAFILIQLRRRVNAAGIPAEG